MSFPAAGNGGQGTPQQTSQAKNNNGPQSVKGNSVNLDRNDLIKLLGVLEGELQAREVVIAVLKSEQIKHLIYPVGDQLAKPGPRNPLTQLWQDVLGAREQQNQQVDVNSIHNLQQVQAKLLENMISQNNELLLKIKERCCSECQCSVLQTNFSLEHILNKEAKEEAERVLEKETKASYVLNQVREREKQMVLLLLNERERLIKKLETARTNCQELLQALREEKMRNSEMVDGLEEESKRSLQMEEQIETATKQYSAHRLQYQSELNTLQEENARQNAEIDRLKAEIEKLSMASGAVRSQVISSQSPVTPKSISVVSPAQLAQRNVAEAPQTPKTGTVVRPVDRPAPPPVPPNKPVILRKPAHLTSGTPSPAISSTAVAQAPPSQDALETEIKNFQSVFVAMKSGTTASQQQQQQQSPQPAPAGGTRTAIRRP